MKHGSDDTPVACCLTNAELREREATLLAQFNLTTEPAPLASQLEDLPQKFLHWQMADLRTHRSIAYEVKANWKLIMLNYNECLHCPILHPALSEFITTRFFPTCC